LVSDRIIIDTIVRKYSDHRSELWQYGTPGEATVFDFRMSRGREAPTFRPRPGWNYLASFP
jgi:hypothetical protein